MKYTILIRIIVLMSSLTALAQPAQRVSIQAGYLYSTSTLIRTSPVLIGLPKFEPLSGFHLGLSLERQLTTLWTTELVLAYQQKGYTTRVPYLDLGSTHTYRYLGLTPMIGIQPIRNLRVLLGPQLNVLVNQSTRGQETQPAPAAHRRLEFGLMGQVSYQRNQVGLTISYFDGLTAYNQTDFYCLTNQNWQLGLFYQLTKK